jgi:hypothetical protein
MTTTRSSDRTVTFRKPFRLAGDDAPFAPGDYLVQTDEEMIDGISFPAWRRTATTIHVRNNGATQARPIDPRALDLMLSRDAVE